MDKRFLDPIGRFSSNDFDIRHMITKVGEEVMRYHYHDFYEIFILIQGELTFILEGRKYQMFPGNILLIHFHDLHRAILSGQGQYERLYFYIEPAYLEKISTSTTPLDRCFTTIKKRRSRILMTNLPEVMPFISNFVHLQPNETFGDDILINCYLLEFLVFINKQLLDQEEELELITVTEHPLIRDVTNYILENLDQPLLVEDLAATFFVSKAHLSREFKKETGFTPHHYINTRKLIYSKELLLQGKKAIDIYFLCGFANYSHFTTAFKKMFHVTPKEFQRNHVQLNNPLIDK